MKILFLDLGSHLGTVACVTEEKVVILQTVDHRIDDAGLVALIEQTIAEAGWTYGDLTHLACVSGPGGFTSLRVGASAMNTLSWTLGIPCAGIRLDALYAARLASVQSVLWVHSTKKKELFVRPLEAKQEPTCIVLDALPSHVAGMTAWAGELLPDQRTVAETAGLMEASLHTLGSVLPAFLAVQSYKKETLVPWYGRGW